VRVAVNDAVVMREWGLAQKVEGKVLLLADADGSLHWAKKKACHAFVG
jgi:peroxiredoxin